jgi:hypothetical protein
MEAWRRKLIFDPLPPLITAENEAIRYYARRDLLGEAVLSIASLWELNQVRRLVRKQKDNGSWPYRGARRTYLRSADNYDQLETYRMVGELVEKFGMTRDHSAMRQAAEYLFRIRRTRVISEVFTALSTLQTTLRQLWSF